MRRHSGSTGRTLCCFAILTPVMARAHVGQWAREVCFVDSIASSDAVNHLITFIFRSVNQHFLVNGGKCFTQNSTKFFPCVHCPITVVCARPILGKGTAPFLCFSTGQRLHKSGLRNQWRYSAGYRSSCRSCSERFLQSCNRDAWWQPCQWYTSRNYSLWSTTLVS